MEPSCSLFTTALAWRLGQTCRSDLGIKGGLIPSSSFFFSNFIYKHHSKIHLLPAAPSFSCHGILWNYFLHFLPSSDNHVELRAPLQQSFLHNFVPLADVPAVITPSLKLDAPDHKLTYNALQTAFLYSDLPCSTSNNSFEFGSVHFDLHLIGQIPQSGIPLQSPGTVTSLVPPLSPKLSTSTSRNTY